MTIKEMIDHLKKYDKDLRVEFETSEGDTIEDFTIDESFGAVIIKEF